MTAEALSAPVSLRSAYVAVPPRECLNGCETRQGAAASKVLCEPGNLLCPRCIDRADTWLREISDMHALLPHVIDHGTVAADPGTKRTKRPDPPAPMRLEVVDLLDDRGNERGVLGIVHAWAELIREERALRRSDGQFHVYAECRLLLAHLPYAATREWAADMYDEVRTLHRTLQDTVGEYRPKPVGRCAAMTDVPGSWENGSTQQTVCDGPLVMDRERVGVHCLRCGARHEANHELRELGLLVDRIFTKEAS